MDIIKRDCFAYKSDDKYKGCIALNQLYCTNEECHFYINKNKRIEAIKKQRQESKK